MPDIWKAGSGIRETHI
jgi:hypothetical protein